MNHAQLIDEYRAGPQKLRAAVAEMTAEQLDARPIHGKWSTKQDRRETGGDGKVVHTPGHTAGSISVLLSSGEAIVGDLLRGGWLGGMFRSGQPSYPYYADDLGQIRASVKRLLTLGTTRFFVGHGGPLDAGRVEEWLERVGGA